MRRVIPVAEEYGVTMALHPDDPPLSSLSGIARLFISVDSYKRAEQMIKSPNWGLLFCIGTFSQMEGGAKNIYEAIDSARASASSMHTCAMCRARCPNSTSVSSAKAILIRLR